MRSPIAWLVALLAALVCGMILQQWQLVRLRGQFVRQEASLAESQQRVADLSGLLASAEAARVRTGGRNQLRGPTEDSAFWRDDERRLMLSGYNGFLARANLPAGRMAQLKDLLVERAQAIFDAVDVAEQEGIADGTPEMRRATTFAIADLDRAIAALLGPASDAKLRELEAIADQDALLAAPAGPVFASALPAAPDYADVTEAAVPYAQIAADYPVVDYLPVAGFSYGVARAGRFNQRPEPGRRLFEVPRPAGTGREFVRTESRVSARTSRGR